MKTGNFIVLEGINGCGKGTQFDMLHSCIRSSGKAVPIFSTGEPNGFDENGVKAREMLKSEGDPYSNNVEAVGYFAENRRTHNDVFVPMLGQGIDVLSDRYWHSNFAFQGAQGISYEDIAKANVGFRVPDLTFLIDVSVDVAFDRLHGRDGVNRRKFDSDRDFLDRVRGNYLELSEVLPRLIRDESIVVVNGDQSVEDVFEEIRSAYDGALRMRNS